MDKGVKAHNNIYGNELADQLAKEATTSTEAETIYSIIPKNAVFRELKEEFVEEWQ
jgi:ribonuclease HI